LSNKATKVIKPQPTRIPKSMREHLKAYAKFHGRKFDSLCHQVLVKFLELRPFDEGLAFHTPLSSRSGAGLEQDWVQINMFITDELNLQAQQLATEKGISKAALFYTALYWFVKYLLPIQLEGAEPGAQAVNSEVAA
jgi:hypothetical protein